MSEQDHPVQPGEKGSQEFTPQIAFALGTINGTVENLRTDLREWKDDVRSDIVQRSAATQETLKDHDSRLRKLEQWKWMIAGAAAAGGLAGGKLMDIIVKVTQ